MRKLGVSLLALLALSAAGVVAVSEEPAKPDYLSVENQALLYQAASAVGALAFCEQQFSYVIPAHADEVAYGKLSAIFAAEEGSPLKALGQLTYRILMLGAEQGSWLQVGIADGKLKPLGLTPMDSREACDGAQQFLEVLMQKGGLLDVKGTRDAPEANAAPGGSGIGS